MIDKIMSGVYNMFRTRDKDEGKELLFAKLLEYKPPEYKKDLVLPTGVAKKIVSRPILDATSTGLKKEDNDLMILLIKVGKALRMFGDVVLLAIVKDTSSPEKDIGHTTGIREFVILPKSESNINKETGILEYRKQEYHPSRYILVEHEDIWSLSLIKAIVRYEFTEDESVRILRHNNLLVYKIDSMNSAFKDNNSAEQVKKRVEAFSQNRDSAKTIGIDGSKDSGESLDFISFDPTYLSQNIDDAKERISFYSSIPQQVLFGMQAQGWNSTDKTVTEYEFLLQAIRRDLRQVIDFYEKLTGKSNELNEIHEPSHEELAELTKTYVACAKDLVECDILQTSEARELLVQKKILQLENSKGEE